MVYSDLLMTLILAVNGLILILLRIKSDIKLLRDNPKCIEELMAIGSIR
jgi:hypothetical protein